ncbi:hypothetical protein XMKAXML_00039 [Enterococcus phage vB_OCPT_PG13]|nr:hypothetical protein XMKAXML_00039 [Enterococcus phage vB_OCPT_PG13]
MITVLNANGQTVAHFVNNVSEGVPYFEPTLTENIETLVSTFSFSVPLDCDESQYLKGLNKVLIKDKDGDLRQFNIIHTEEVFQEVDSRILVECEDFSISEMNDTVIYPFNGHNLGDTLTKAVKGTGWGVEYSADTWQEGEVPFILADYTNMREVFGNIQKTYDVDFKFTAERTAFNQTKRIVKVYKNRGLQTGRYFTYDRDVLGITRDVRYDTIKTAILPYYTGVDGNVWTLKGMVPVNPIEGITKDKESPLVVHNQAHADYDEPFFFKAMPFKASSTNPEQVYRQGVEELLKYIAPIYTYTVNVILLNRVQGWEGETLALGDTVWMKERVGSREIGLEARVIEYVYHEDDPSLDEVTFTNFREIDTYDTSDIAGIRDALNDLKDQVDSNTVIIETTREQISKLEEGQEGIITDLNNKNSISIGDTPKPNPIDGDTWFSTRVNEAGQTIHEIKVWDGVEKVWKLSMDTSKAFEAEDTAKAAQKDAEESLDKANKAVADAENAVVIGEGNAAKIITMEEAINLRVEKNDVINQINVSTEGIIIDGAKVQITGKTYIEDAVITDAMISDLSATKLTAGVIDASKINVTNIDASNIKAGTIQGIDIIGSKITNPFSIGSEGYTLDGQTVMERAQVKIDYTVSETGQKGWSILHARGIQNQLLNQNGTINSFSSLASDGLSIQDSLGNRGYLSAELLMQFSNTGKKIYPGNSWVTNTDRIVPSLTMNKCAIGWLFLWQPYDTTGGKPYTWDYTYYLVPKAHANFNSGKGINMRLQGAGKGGGADDTVYKYVYVSNDSITGTVNNGTGNGAKWVLTSVFSV